MKKSEAKKRKKKVMLIATLSTAAIIVGGLTFAWYTSRDAVTNTFQTSGSLKTVVVENFTPPTNWQPGVTTDKVVQVTNTGTVDAYTRVRLDEELTYYKKGDAVPLVEGVSISDYSADLVPYVQVDAEAIEKAVATWNNAHLDTNNKADANGVYVQISEADLTSVYGVPKEVASKLKIWVKKATGTSNDSDSKQVENGVNYEFIGYYDTGEVDSSVSGATTTTIDSTTGKATVADTASKKKICYELKIVPTITDKQTITDGVTSKTDSGVTDSVKTDITHTLGYKLNCSIYEATKVVVDGTKTDDPISKYIELEFNTAGTSGQSDWYFNSADGYYYYRGIVPSGQTTTPLLKAVRMRSDVGNDIINATYNLTVVDESTQATEAAFTGTWADATYSTIITNLSKTPTTNSNIVATTSNSKCEYKTCGGTLTDIACSIDLDGTIGSSRKHIVADVVDARQTAAGVVAETETTTETTSETTSEITNNGGEQSGGTLPQ